MTKTQKYNIIIGFWEQLYRGGRNFCVISIRFIFFSRLNSKNKMVSNLKQVNLN